jgi:hypothetical protein
MHKALNELSELRMALLNQGLIVLVLSADVREKLLKVLRVIHYQFVNYGFVQVNTGELVRIALNDDGGHRSEML